jgi:hypothetical protein
MRPKVFTLDEANSTIPKISQALDRIVAINERVKTLTQDIKDLFDIWGESIYDPKNIDHKYCHDKLMERNALLQELQYHINNVQGLGCFVKDVNQGLVDFYSEKDGQLIFLCWRRGESVIRFWHKINDGFSARRSVEELAAPKAVQKAPAKAAAEEAKPQYIN